MESLTINIHQSDVNTTLIELLAASRAEQTKNRAIIEALAKTLASWQKSDESEDAYEDEPVEARSEKAENFQPVADLPAEAATVVIEPSVQPNQF